MKSFALNKTVLPVALFTVVFILAVLLRVYAIDRIPGINGDEAFPTVQMREMTRGKAVQLWVPTQRLLSPIYASLVLVVQYFRDDFTLLNIRLPAMLSGLLLLVSSFLLLRKSLPHGAFIIAMLFIAAFPMSIAYSRSAVEQSLMGVAGLVCLYFAVMGRWKQTLFAFSASLLVHPVNVFLLPLLIAPLIAHEWMKPVALKTKSLRILGFFVIFSVMLVVLLSTLPPEYSYLNILSVSRYLLHAPVAAAMDLGRFYLYYARLFSGVTTFEYFANPTPETWTLATDILAASLIAVLFLFGGVKLWKSRQYVGFSLLLGLMFSLVCFFVAAGPRALAPGLSRHSNYLTVPSAVVFAWLLSAIAGEKRQRAVELGAGLVSLCMLFQFWLFYFEAVKKDGGGFTHPTYLTGATEPKKAIYDWIASTRKNEPTLVFVEDWWTYWPIRYLALANPQYEVVLLDAQNVKYLKHSPAFIAVGQPDGPVASLLQELPSINLKESFTANSYGNKPTLIAWVLQQQ